MDEVMAILFAVIISFFIWLGNGYSNANRDWERKPIELGYAIYCPNNGKFAFKGERKEIRQ